MLPARRRGVARPLPHPCASDPHGVRFDYLHQNRQQVEYRTHRTYDLLPRGRREHPGTARLTREMREQNPDAYQDRIEL